MRRKDVLAPRARMWLIEAGAETCASPASPRNQQKREEQETMAITLVNLFNHIPEDRLDAFDARWAEVAKQMQAQPGAITFHFYRAAGADQEFPILQVTDWESRQHFQHPSPPATPAEPPPQSAAGV